MFPPPRYPGPARAKYPCILPRVTAETRTRLLPTGLPGRRSWKIRGCPPAAKAVAEVCAAVDVAALSGDGLIDYLRNTSEDCLYSTLWPIYNPSIARDLVTIFSDANLQSVFAAIEQSAAPYDGTNSTGMLQLWLFVQIGKECQRDYSEETGVGPWDVTTDSAYLAASDAFAASDHFNASKEEAARILIPYFEVAFIAGLRRNHLAPVKQVLSEFTPERAANESQVCEDLGDGIQGCSPWAPQRWAFETVLRRVIGSFVDRDEGIKAHPEFHQTLEQDRLVTTGNVQTRKLSLLR